LVASVYGRGVNASNSFIWRTIMYKEIIYLNLILILVLTGSLAADPFQQDPGPDGIVSIEAENYDDNIERGGIRWEEVGPTDGFTGAAGMQVLGTSFYNPGYSTQSPQLDYEINFDKTGTYYVWILAWAASGSDDSCHVGLDGEETPLSSNWSGGGNNWSNDRYPETGRAQFDVNTPGLHVLNIWVREDGLIIDKILLTINPDYVPTGAGPPESWRGPRLKAYNPSPADGSQHSETWVSLSWTAGDTAVSHDVYMGENFNDVNEGTADTFRGNYAAVYFVVGFPGNPYPDGLVPGTTYYWRVDEIESDQLKHKGDVWSFTVPPLKAYNPIPPDNAKFVTTDVKLNWTEGISTKLQYVYFGNDFDTINNASGAPPQITTTYSPSALEPDTVYYWRVDVFDGTTTHKGDVWTFRTLPEIVITDPNLVGWWKFDAGFGNTVVDWSGHANNGKIVGDPQWIEGFDGGAIEFNGSDYIELPTNLVGSDVGSVTMWIKTEQTSIGMILYGSDGTGGNGYGDENEMHINIDNGGIVDCFIEFADSDLSVETPTVNDNSWHHIAATWDINGQVMLYLDGGEPVSASHNGNNFRFSGCLRIGSPNNSERFYIGSLDDVRLYNRVLSVVEINETMRGAIWHQSTMSISELTKAPWLMQMFQHQIFIAAGRAQPATHQRKVLNGEEDLTTGASTSTILMERLVRVVSGVLQSRISSLSKISKVMIPVITKYGIHGMTALATASQV